MGGGAAACTKQWSFLRTLTSGVTVGKCRKHISCEIGLRWSVVGSTTQASGKCWRYCSLGGLCGVCVASGQSMSDNEEISTAKHQFRHQLDLQTKIADEGWLLARVRLPRFGVDAVGRDAGKVRLSSSQ